MSFKKKSGRVIIWAVGLSCLVSYVSTLTINLDNQWEMFKNAFNKTYETECEENKRREIFENNVAFIANHNLQENMGLHSFTLGINPQADLDAEEFKSWTTCYKPASDSIDEFNLAEKDVSEEEIYNVPPTLDYRKKDMVSNVSDQGKCNACYAFAAMGALEAQMKKKTGKLVPLSVQNIIDCSEKEGNEGCKAGDIKDAYNYVMINNGVDSLDSYPFMGKNGTCRFNPAKIAGNCNSFKTLQKDEKSILKALKDNGPISVGMSGHSKLFQHYKSGVFEDPECEGNLTTAVLIIGYGKELGKEYWLAKNSHGTKWGEKGFFKILKGKNMCRIADDASYPEV